MKVAYETADAMAAHWSARAHRFDGAASHNHHRDAWRHVFSEAVGDQPGDVVDLGCGTGACAILLAEMGHRVTAVDGAAGMLEHARRSAQQAGVEIDFIERDMDRAGLPGASADVVTLRNVLWTLEAPAAALRLAHRLLRPGGVVLVSDGLWRKRADPQLAALNGYLPYANGVREDDARALLNDAGFGDIASWQHLFPSAPYGDMYDAPGTPICYFVLTAMRYPVKQ